MKESSFYLLIEKIKNGVDTINEFIGYTSKHKPYIETNKIKNITDKDPKDLNYINFKYEIEKRMLTIWKDIEGVIGLESDNDKKRRIYKAMGYITKKDLINAIKSYGMELTDRLLSHYKEIGLIKQPPGAIDCYKKDTPNILYVIRELKESGFKIKLEKFKYWLELLELNENAVHEIKNIYQEYKKHLKDIFQNFGITPKKRMDLIRTYDMRIFDYEVMVTRYDILKRIFQERSYTEFDQKEITELYANYLDTNQMNFDYTEDWESVMDASSNPVDDALSFPEFRIDLNIPEIILIYSDPVNKTVVFKQDGLIEVI